MKENKKCDCIGCLYKEGIIKEEEFEEWIIGRYHRNKVKDQGMSLEEFQGHVRRMYRKKEIDNIETIPLIGVNDKRFVTYDSRINGMSLSQRNQFISILLGLITHLNSVMLEEMKK